MSFNIKISFLSLLADIVGKEYIITSINENTQIKDLIEILIIKMGKNFKNIVIDSSGNLSKHIIFGLNGKDIRFIEGLNTEILEEDELVLLPAIAGG